MPYGTVDSTLPYIARRATENRSILENAKRERLILRAEILRRFQIGFGAKNDPFSN